MRLAERATRFSAHPSRFSARREVALGLGVYALYLLVRAAVMNERGQRAAVRNAERVVALERRLGIHVEPAIQRAALPHGRALATANVSYMTLNIGVTIGWLALLHVRRDPRYYRWRTAWLIASLSAQPVYLILPTAPPRALDGFTDTLKDGGLDIDATPIAHLYDPIGAMPSIHVAYSIVAAGAIRDTARSRALRVAVAGYPVTVAAIVLATANHFALDVAAGGALGLAATALAHPNRPPLPLRSPSIT